MEVNWRIPLQKKIFYDQCDLECPYGDVEESLVGSTQPLKNISNLEIMRTDTGSAKLSWIVETDVPNGFYRLDIFKNGTIVESIYDNMITTWQDPCPSIGDTYGFQTSYVDPFVAYSSQTIISSITFTQMVYDLTPPPMGKISGVIKTTNGSGVPNVLVEVILQNQNDISNGSCWPTTYSKLTDATGAYTIPFIYWGIGNDQADYLVRPSLVNHGFDPGEVTVSLTNGDFVKEVNFTDTTAFSIKGFVRDVKDCGVDSVFIRTTSGTFLSTFTKPDGSYDLVVPETGTYTIEAIVDTFDLGTQTIIVNEDVQDKDFDYLETDTLNLYVGAGCFEYIGQAQVDIRSKGGCQIQTVQTNLSGFVNDLVLPKREMTIEVVSIDPPNVSGLDANDIIADIGGEKTIDLDSTHHNAYHLSKTLKFRIIWSARSALPCSK